MSVGLYEPSPALPDIGQVPLDPKYAVPRPRPGTVSRGDLVAAARSAACRLVAVTAPAGYGKSAFLAEWAAREDRPVAWVSLDRFDDEPATLLTSLASACGRAGLGDPDRCLDPRDQHLPALTRAARLAAALRAGTAPFVFMLDDLQELRTPACRDVLGLLLAAIPPGSQLAAASRDEQPELPRLRAAADALEVGPADLTLDADGARQVFAAARVSLDPEQAAAVTKRTEGWPAGLYLAALIARESPGRATGLTGEDRYVADYLYREALVRQPQAIQRFLRRTAVLDRLCAPLCAAVLRSPAAGAQLRQVEGHSLFLTPLDREREWFRYHPLFREFLLGELRRTEPGLVATLHERAAGWHETRDAPAPAVEHLLQAGDQDRAARLVTRLARPTWMAGHLTTVRRWYQAVGDAVSAQHPPLAALRCWEGLLTGDPAGALRWADVVEEASFDDVPGDGAASFASARAMLRAALCADGPEAMTADAAFAAAREPAWSPWRDTALWLLAEAHLLAGDAGQARPLLTEASALAATFGNVAAIPVCEAQLALLDMDRARWPDAAARLDRALAAIEEGGLHDYPGSLLALAAAARLAVHHGDQKQARARLAQALRGRAVASYLLPHLAVRLRLQLARVCHTLADPETTQTLVGEIDGILSRRPALGALAAETGQFRALVAAGAGAGTAGTAALTPAELRLLPYLQTHLTADMIAKELFISSHTVKTEVKAIYRKLGVSCRNDAVRTATSLGLLGG